MTIISGELPLNIKAKCVFDQQIKAQSGMRLKLSYGVYQLLLIKWKGTSQIMTGIFLHDHNKLARESPPSQNQAYFTRGVFELIYNRQVTPLNSGR